MHMPGLRPVTVIPSRQFSSALVPCLHLTGILHIGSHGGGQTGAHTGAGLHTGGQTGAQTGAGLHTGAHTGLHAGGHTGLHIGLQGCSQTGAVSQQRS